MILAAGRGTRIQEVTLGTRPKGLLEVGGMSLVRRSVAVLASCGVSTVHLVTGHGAASYRSAFADDPRVTLIHNSAFDRGGSLGSLACAAAVVAPPFLLVESDLLYDERAVAALLGAAGEDSILVTALSSHGDEVLVGEHHGRLTAMSKDRASVPAPCGQFAGISRVGPLLLAALAEAAVASAASGNERPYEYAMADAAGTVEVQCVKCHGIPWAEIDTPADLLRAERDVLPLLSSPAMSGRG